MYTPCGFNMIFSSKFDLILLFILLSYTRHCVVFWFLHFSAVILKSKDWAEMSQFNVIASLLVWWISITFTYMMKSCRCMTLEPTYIYDTSWNSYAHLRSLYPHTLVGSSSMKRLVAFCVLSVLIRKKHVFILPLCIRCISYI